MTRFIRSDRTTRWRSHCYNGLVSVIKTKVMETKSIKEKARSLIDKLPENSTWDDLMHEIYVRQAIESGLNDSEAGNVVSVEEVRSKFGLQK
ncbi:MAG: hypothetical protein ACKPA7_28420 [Sphaerospermopsis kisseleviana]